MNSPPQRRSAARASGAPRNQQSNNGTLSIPQQQSARKVDCPPADKHLAEYILRHHLARLQSAWELAVCQSLSRVKGELSRSQSSALASIWARIQRQKAVR
jgi:hypothetical protein